VTRLEAGADAGTGIGDAERAQLENDGFVVLRGLFDAAAVLAAAAEAQALLQREDLTARTNLRARRTWNMASNGEVLELLDPVVDVSPLCASLANDPRLVQAITALREVPEVALYKDKLIFKPPGTVGYPLHQDYIAWPSFPESFTTAVIALDASAQGSGAVEVFRGAHARGCLAPRDGGFHMLDEKTVAGHERVFLEMEPGDVAIYGCFMPHRSGINQSGAPRRHLLVSYADGADADGGRRADHYDDFHHWLREVYGSMGIGDMHFR